MPISDLAATAVGEELDRFEAFVGRAQPPPVGSTVASERTVGAGTQSDPPGLGRTIVIASVVTVTIVLVAVTAGLLAAGASVASSLGIGVFAAFWGGGGFGAMIGGVTHAHRSERATAIPSVVGSAEDLSPALLPAWPSTTSVRATR